MNDSMLGDLTLSSAATTEQHLRGTDDPEVAAQELLVAVEGSDDLDLEPVTLAVLRGCRLGAQRVLDELAGCGWLVRHGWLDDGEPVIGECGATPTNKRGLCAAHDTGGFEVDCAPYGPAWQDERAGLDW